VGTPRLLTPSCAHALPTCAMTAMPLKFAFIVTNW
jgi:hypothetical protein